MGAVAYLVNLVAHLAAVAVAALLIMGGPSYLGRKWLAFRGLSRPDDHETERGLPVGFFLFIGLMLCAMLLAVRVSAFVQSEVMRRHQAPVYSATLPWQPIPPVVIDSKGRVWDAKRGRWFTPSTDIVRGRKMSRLEQFRRSRAELIH